MCLLGIMTFDLHFHLHVFIYFNIWQTLPDSLSITIKQNVRLNGRMHSEKYQLDQIQNSRLPAIIYFKLICLPDSWTIRSYKTIDIIHVQFWGRIYPEYLQLDHIKNGPVASIIDLISVIIYMANHVR